MKDFLINAGYYTRVEPLQHVLVKSVESALYLLWGGAVFVLLIGGLNVTNLALARSSARSKEIAKPRLALGAGRAQIARQTIVENVLLAGAGGIAGVLRGVTLVLEQSRWPPVPPPRDAPHASTPSKSYARNNRGRCHRSASEGSVLA